MLELRKLRLKACWCCGLRGAHDLGGALGFWRLVEVEHYTFLLKIRALDPC